MSYRKIAEKWLYLFVGGSSSYLADELVSLMEGCRADRSPEQIDEIVRLNAERDRLRGALNLAGKNCEQVHHPKKMQHDGGQPCPVEALIQAALAGAGKTEKEEK